MSPEEVNLLDNLVAISCQTKQDYITRKLLDRRIVVVPSSRMQKGVEEAMMLIYRELTRLASSADASPELLALADSVATIFSGLHEGGDDVRQASDESAIKNLKREGAVMRQLTARTAKELLEDPIEEADWVIEDLLLAGAHILAGAPKTGSPGWCSPWGLL